MTETFNEQEKAIAGGAKQRQDGNKRFENKPREIDIKPVTKGKVMKGVKRNESKEDKTNNWKGFTDKIC